MFRRVKIIIAVSLTLMFAVGLTANAQIANNQLRNQNKQRMNQQARTNQQQTAGPNGMRRPGVRLMSVEGLLLPPMRPRIVQIAKRIGLDNKQQAGLIALSNKFYKEMKPVLIERAQSMREVRRIMMSKNADDSLSTAAEKVRNADEKILEAEISFWTDFKSILTPQQQADMNKMNQSMEANQQQKMNANQNNSYFSGE